MWSIQSQQKWLLVVFVVCLPGLRTGYSSEDGLCLSGWKHPEFGLLHLQTRDRKGELRWTVGNRQWSGRQLASPLLVPAGAPGIFTYKAHLYSVKPQICVIWLYRKDAFQFPCLGRWFDGGITLLQLLISIAEIFGLKGCVGQTQVIRWLNRLEWWYNHS